MTGGGVVQVGKKRAPQGLFLRNFTPHPHMWGLIESFFSSSEVDFFDVAKLCKIFSSFFHENFMIFSEKNAPQGDDFSENF